MDMKSKARISGLLEFPEWTKEMEAYRTILERETHQPLPNEMFLDYAKQLSDKEKLTIALTLEFPFARRELRKWPDMLFVKLLRTYVQQSSGNIALKRRLMLTILQRLRYKGDEEWPALADLLDEQEERLEAEGYWPHYWTMYFHPAKSDEHDLWLLEMKKLEERWLQNGDSSSEGEEIAEVESPEEEQADNSKLDKKIKILGDLYKKESSTRQRLEHDLVQKNKLLRMKSKEMELLDEEIERLKDDAEQAAAMIAQQQRTQAERDRHWKQEQADWLEERHHFMEQIRALNQQTKRLDRTIEEHKKELDYQEKDKANLRQAISDARNQLNSPESIARLLSHSIEIELASVAQSIPASRNDSSRQAAQASRARIRKGLDLLDALDHYLLLDTLPTEEEQPDRAKQTAVPIDYEEQEPLTEEDNALPPVHVQPSANSLYGTFFRRDHGGFIRLDNGESFNITESLVQQHELQHEAELLCTPVKQDGKSLYYDLQLLFQGDDAFSPIQQLDGYIETGEGHLWFCVDMNDPSSRYQIHYKDIEIQKPSHGDPCSFNVAEGSHIARLTKLYRLQGEALVLDAGKAKPMHPAQAEQSGSKKSKEKKKQLQSKEQPAPFLQDCLITIVGGVRKWFEHVVHESGAELAHDTGDHPERLAAELRRSQALFLLITSTSHRATWDGIDIAKMYGIPHFIIQGSKSNLRSLLWDNREIISKANR
ncbi:hypothetical protein [Paenibacillus paeoniae]|uniref:DUF2325 domain-containing protein n=1 Tax=Paenibacillus paeoniae TaxID=2292705 RepID=A0A371PMW3_9BACL|nr:hypothetical protein [Paenibacillus paeoniae]REK77536.1 hypothetical protein DX130_11235 [Paenibacillus paeoniae]